MELTLYNKYATVNIPYCERIFWLSLDETIHTKTYQLVSWLVEQKKRI
jgi:hypothetical protein